MKKIVNEEQPKPNVLFIAMDDLNNWITPISGYSNAKTPNFERLQCTRNINDIKSNKYE
tara:strand:+ start:3951 stop:4127 length:177 start_codon:yes stop_codon:yes gene_type:complete